MLDHRVQANLQTEQDNFAIAQIMARAFQNEPAFSYIISNPDVRARKLHGAFMLFLRDEHRKGAVYATAGFEAATLWRRPGEAKDNLWDTIRLGIPFLHQFGGAIFRALELSESMKKHMPTEPCWYLHFAGCDPAFQGQGFGGAAIRAGLECVDAQGMSAYLETADEANIGLYARFGFEIIRNWHLPEGPQFWGMWRKGKTRH